MKTLPNDRSSSWKMRFKAAISSTDLLSISKSANSEIRTVLLHEPSIMLYVHTLPPTIKEDFSFFFLSLFICMCQTLESAHLHLFLLKEISFISHILMKSNPLPFASRNFNCTKVPTGFTFSCQEQAVLGIGKSIALP